jgi:hypothetical protein
MPGVHATKRRPSPRADPAAGAWVYWAYGAGFDRQTEMHVRQAGLQLFESRFVANELIKLLGARA